MEAFWIFGGRVKTTIFFFLFFEATNRKIESFEIWKAQYNRIAHHLSLSYHQSFFFKFIIRASFWVI
jgi:hypothetical protein